MVEVKERFDNDEDVSAAMGKDFQGTHELVKEIERTIGYIEEVVDPWKR